MKSPLWTRDELLVAFNMYCRIPFGKLHHTNPEIIALARTLNRTSSAIAMKLVNFASFDPTHRARNVSGLKHASRADKAIWDEFNSNWEKLAYESQQALSRLGYAREKDIKEDEFEAPTTDKATEANRITRVRLVQSFFRTSVLASYEYKCAFCALPFADLLNASHIIPWGQDVERRADPRNGISLCAIHDRAFDRGYLSLSNDFKVLVSPKVKTKAPASFHRAALLDIEGLKMATPNRFAPDLAALNYHRENIFRY